jgi:hypothetical protein
MTFGMGSISDCRESDPPNALAGGCPAALSALVDAGQDTVIREVEQRLGLFRGQSHVRAHGTTLGSGCDRLGCLAASPSTSLRNRS